MSSYYYLMAQLPGILANGPLPVTYFDFIQTAFRFLTPADRRILDRLSLEPPRRAVPAGSAVVDGFWRKERALRIALERLRAARLGREVHHLPEEDDLVSANFDAVHAARAASSIDNPLEAERFLDLARAGFVDTLRENHFFDSDAVFAYGLMLLLRERGEKFTAEAGRASYTTIYNQILGEEA